MSNDKLIHFDIKSVIGKNKVFGKQKDVTIEFKNIISFHHILEYFEDDDWDNIGNCNMLSNFINEIIDKNDCKNRKTVYIKINYIKKNEINVRVKREIIT